MSSKNRNTIRPKLGKPFGLHVIILYALDTRHRATTFMDCPTVFLSSFGLSFLVFSCSTLGSQMFTLHHWILSVCFCFARFCIEEFAIVSDFRLGLVKTVRIVKILETLQYGWIHFTVKLDVNLSLDARVKVLWCEHEMSYVLHTESLAGYTTFGGGRNFCIWFCWYV